MKDRNKQVLYQALLQALLHVVPEIKHHLRSLQHVRATIQDTQTDARHRHTETQKHRNTETHGHTDTQTHGHRHTDTRTKTHRHTDTQTYTRKHTHTTDPDVGALEHVPGHPEGGDGGDLRGAAAGKRASRTSHTRSHIVCGRARPRPMLTRTPAFGEITTTRPRSPRVCRQPAEPQLRHRAGPRDATTSRGRLPRIPGRIIRAATECEVSQAAQGWDWVRRCLAPVAAPRHAAGLT